MMNSNRKTMLAIAENSQRGGNIKAGRPLKAEQQTHIPNLSLIHGQILSNEATAVK